MERIKLDELDTVKGGDSGYELEIKDPAGRVLPGNIRVRGYDSDSYNAMLDEQQRARQGRMAMGRAPTVEEMRAEALELAAVLVMGWTVPFDVDGKAFDYSGANAVTLLKRWPWVRDQVERAAGVRANFLQGPASSSSPTPPTSGD